MFEPSLVGIIDADNFSILNSPDTSAYTTPFNGIMQGEYVVNNTGSHLAGYGFSHRFSVCAGPCGATVTGLESLVVHKVAQNLSDTSLTTKAISPDPNWYGVQTKDAVLLVPRNGAAQSNMGGFTTTHSGTARYLFGGVTAGNYTVTINGTPVGGSPFTVTDGSNAIAFTSTAGTVSVNGSGILPGNIALNPPTMNFTCLAGGIADSQPFNISSTGTPLDNWSATKTQPWLTLSPASGTTDAIVPVSVDCTNQSPGTYTDTITVASTTVGVVNSPQTVSVSVAVTGVSSPGTPSVISGKITASGNVVIH